MTASDVWAYVTAAIPILVVLLRAFGPALVARWPNLDKPVRAVMRAAPDFAAAHAVATGKWDPEVLARLAYEAYVLSLSDGEQTIASKWEDMGTREKAPWIASVSAVVSLKPSKVAP